MVSCFILITALVSCQEKENPLTPLTAIAKQLNKGASDFLSGTDPAVAFTPWQLAEMNPEKLNKIREDLKAAGVASLTSMGFEFELILLKEGKPVYLLRTFVLAREEETAFLEFKGRPDTSKNGSPLDNYKDGLAPFSEAAAALWNVIQSKDASKLPLVRAETMNKILPGMGIKVEQELTKSKKNMDAALEELAALAPDEILLHIDDQNFLAQDSTGTSVGFLSGEFELRKDGRLEFALKKFEPLPKK